MTSGEIKQFIVDNFFNDPALGNLANPKKWKREQKIKFSTFEEFNEKYHNLEIEEIIEQAVPDFQHGIPPVDNTQYVFRHMMNYGTDEGDYEMLVFTDATDSKIVFVTGASD